MEKSTPTLNKVIKIDKQHYLADADLRGTPDGAARCPGRSRMRYQDQGVSRIVWVLRVSGATLVESHPAWEQDEVILLIRA